MTDDLKGKVALVTGGAKGIGEATVCLLVEKGARVVIADMDVAAGNALADALADTTFIRTDVSDEASVSTAVDRTVDRFGGLDIMVNNAGVVGAVGPVQDTSAQDWSRTLAILLDGVFYGMKHAARVMTPRGSGVILSISSNAGLRGGLGPHAYTAAKTAVVGLTMSVASELAAYGIRVNAVAPGMTVTSMIADLFGDADAARNQSAQVSALGTPLLPSEIAAALAFLASDGAKHITGEVIAVDSGLARNGVGQPRFHTMSAGFLGKSSA